MQGVVQSNVSGQHLIGRPLQCGGIDPAGVGEVSLSVKIHQQHVFLVIPCQNRSQILGRGRFADPAFLIGDGAYIHGLSVLFCVAACVGAIGGPVHAKMCKKHFSYLCLDVNQ